MTLAIVEPDMKKRSAIIHRIGKYSPGNVLFGYKGLDNALHHLKTDRVEMLLCSDDIEQETIDSLSEYLEEENIKVRIEKITQFFNINIIHEVAV